MTAVVVLAALGVYIAGCIVIYRELARTADRIRSADDDSAPASSVSVNRPTPPGADGTVALDGVAGPDFGVPRPDHFHTDA